MAYDTKDMNEIADLLDKVEKKHITTPQQVRQRVDSGSPKESQVVSESVTPTKEDKTTVEEREISPGLSDAIERLQEINRVVGDLSSEAEELVNKYFPAQSIEAERSGVFQWGWSSDPNDITFNSILDEIEEGVYGQEDETEKESVAEPKESKTSEIKKALEEAGLGESINYYQDKLEYIVEPDYELHAVDIDEERGDIELEFTYKKTRDTYSISYNHFDGKMSVGVASDGDEKYKIIDADDFRKSDYHDTVYTALELEIDSLSRFVDEEPDDRDYEDDERLGRMGYGKDQAN